MAKSAYLYQGNSFIKGMNSDLLKSVQAQDTYVDALNMRLLSDDGQSSYGLNNTLGNKLDVNFPTISAVYKLTPSTAEPNAAWTLTLVIYYKDLNSIAQSKTLNLSGSIGTYEDIMSIIMSEIEADVDLAANGITTAVSSQDSFVIYSSSTALITGMSLTPTYYNYTVLVPEVSDIVPIAYTAMRDSIIVMTTSKSGELTGKDGQLWKLNYDKAEDEVTSYELLYNAPLNINLNYPIRRMVAIYENSLVQRIYWTDAYNPIRTINIADEDVMGTPVELINITPGASVERLRLKEIKQGGKQGVGLYAYTHRLKKGGAASMYAPHSNLITITESIESAVTQREKYNGGTAETDSGKSIELVIDNLDLNYNTLDLVQLYYKDRYSDPEVRRISDYQITDTTMTFIISGNEEFESTSIDEISSVNGVDLANDLMIKDNRLFPVGIQINDYNEIEFNCRAYRYTYQGNTYVSDANVDPFSETISQDDKDAINPYNTNFEILPSATDRYIYQSDGVTVGGEGPNVKYEIMLREIAGYSATLPTEFVSPITTKTKTTDTIITDGEYYNVDMWKDFKSPYVISTMTGYKAGEVYRFGMVIYDKNNRPGFVHWIGDIKFPHHHEMDSNDALIALNVYGDDDTITGTAYPTPSDDDTGKNKMYTMGVRFTVDNLNTILSQASGFRIVRVKRDNNNKTIIGTGLLNGMYGQDNLVSLMDGTIYNKTADDGYRPHWWDMGEPGDGRSTQHMTIDCPDFMFEEDSRPRVGDLIFNNAYTRVSNLPTDGILTRDDNNTDMNNNKTQYIYRVLDVLGRTTPELYQIEETTYLDKAEQYTAEDGNIICNISGFQDIDIYTAYAYLPINRMEGGPTIYCRTNQAYTRVTDDGTTSGTFYHYVKSLATVVRPMYNQYGGATSSARSKNTYIACSNFIPLRDDSAATAEVSVFGGDCYNVNYDFYKGIANWNTSGAFEDISTYLGGDYTDFPSLRNQDVGFQGTTSLAYVIPLTSSVNTELRTGFHFVTDLIDNKFRDLINGMAVDTFALDPVFYREQDTELFVPKPITENFVRVFDNRIYASDPKIYGETVDSWRTFSTYLDVNGSYGALNYVEQIGERVFFFQDKACGVLAINPKAAVQTTDNISLELAKGDVLYDYSYISIKYGSIHKPIASSSAIYFYDSGSRKLNKITASEGMTQLTDMKGISAYLYNNVKGEILKKDNPYLGYGLTGYYDQRFNEVYFTFRSFNLDAVYSALFSVPSPERDHGVTNRIAVVQAVYNDINVGDYLLLTSDDYSYQNKVTEKAIISGTYYLYLEDQMVFAPFATGNISRISYYNTTISYNELLSAFVSRHSFTPWMYITNYDYTLSPNELGDLYAHNKGEYCNFYGTVYDSSLQILVNPYPTYTKTFDILSMYLETLSTDTDAIRNLNEHVDSVRFFTDYQNTDWYSPTTAGLYKTIYRAERDWNIPIPGSIVIDPTDGIFNIDNLNPNATYKPRLRDKYMTADLVFDNTLNRRRILHSIKSLFRISAH